MKVGILGGGQLGRMMVQEASRLDIDVWSMDKSIDFPVPDIWPHFREGDFTNFDDVIKFGEDCDIITIEIESVNIDALRQLERDGKKVFPQPEILEIIADKGLQKQFYTKNGIPTSHYEIASKEDFSQIKTRTFRPFVQKLRHGGYDGKGVQIIRSKDELTSLWQEPSVIEELVDIDKELSVIVCRDEKGNIVSYPAVEMEFHPTANLVEFLFSPSLISSALAEEATVIAHKIAERLGIVGLLAVEMFLDKNGQLLVNEIAPRPHNSGHHTIEACYTSQFEQHLRAITGLPLGSTKLIMPAVMINLLGEKDHSGLASYKGLNEALLIEGVYPHIYGKKETKPMRKMGHVTIISDFLPEAIEKAKKVKNLIKVVASDN